MAPTGTPTVNLYDVHVNPSYIVREIDSKTVRNYVNMLKAGCVPPPVTVATINGVLTLLCGQHRRAAAMDFDIGLAYPAKFIEVSAAEAHWVAAQDNLANGLQLKPSDRREVVRRFIKAHKYRNAKGEYLSYREILICVNGIVSLGTLHNLVRSEFPRLARAMGGYHEIPRGTGGLNLAPTKRPDVYFREHIGQAQACVSSALDPLARQRCFEAVMALAKMIEASGPMDHPDY